MQPRRTQLVDDTFFVAVIAKGLGGLVELTSGILLIFLSVPTLQRLLAPLAHIGISTGSSISAGTKLFVVLYFGIRGFIRVILAISLLREQLWAYPVSIVLLGAAIAYQVWLLVSGHFSSALTLLTLFDCAVVGLTWHEYRKLSQGGHLTRPHL